LNESIVVLKDVLVYIAMFIFMVLIIIFVEISYIRKHLKRLVEADIERAIRECGQQPFRRVYDESPWYRGEDGELHEKCVLKPREVKQEGDE
jgi:DNA-binding transcriptional ArsR family regulator